MKRNRLSVIALMLCILLIASALLLCACNKRGNNDTAKQKRDSATISVIDALLNGMDSDWSYDVDNATLSNMDNAGDYIITSEWTMLICNAIKASTMQTEKIEALATTLKSEEGKEMLSSFDENIDLLIPLLKQTGVTASDISNLVIELMNALVANSEIALDNMLTRLNEVKSLSFGNAKVQESVNKGIASVNSAKSVLTPALNDKQVLLTAFANARNAVGEIVEFAYTMSMDDITENIIDALLSEDGALGGITNSELITLTNTLMQNITSLKSALTDQEIEYLNVALDIVIDRFDTNAIASQVYAQIVKFAKYAYTMVDIIPALCDVVVAGGDILSDEEFLNSLKTYVDGGDNLNDDVKQMNTVIITAKVVDEVMKSFDKADLDEIIDTVGDNSVEEYQKAVPLMTLDLLLNFGALADGSNSGSFVTVHPDVITQEVLYEEMALVLFFNNGIDAFKQAYYEYNRGEIDIYMLQQKARDCSFENFGVVNPFNAVVNTKGWYEYYISEGIKAVNNKIKDRMPSIIKDLKLFVDDYYAQNSAMKSAISTLADMSLFNNNIAMDAYTQLLKDSCLMGVLYLGSLI